MLLIALLILVGTWLVTSGQRSRADGRALVISSIAGGTHTYALSETRKIKIEGTLGPSEIEISDGAAAFVASPCPHKLCIKRGSISRAGEWAACLPNGIVARIEGEAGYDGITP